MSQEQTSDIKGQRIPILVFSGLLISSMAAMLGMGILLPILPNFARHLGASDVLIGFIFAEYALARGIFSPVIGKFSDQYGRKNIMLAGLILYALLSLGYSFLNHLYLLAILWFLQGVASSLVTPIAQSYVGDITPEGKEGRIMNLFYLGMFGGTAIGPVLGGFLVDHISFAAPFYLMSGAALFGFLIILFAVPEAPNIKKHKNSGEKIQFKESFLTVIKDRKMKGILSYLVGRGFYRWGFNTFFPIYAVTIATLSQSQVGLILSSYMVAGTLLQYPFGWLSDRFSNHRAELVAIGGGIAAITSFVIPELTHLNWLIVLVVVMGIFSSLSRASVVAIRTERGRIFGMGAVTGVFTAGISLGQVLGPVGFGVISESFNIPDCFYFGAIIGMITTGMAYRYLHNKSEYKLVSATN